LGLREAFRPANALLLAVLTVCTIVLILPANVVTTMGDPGFASYMGIGRADLRIDVPAGSADLDTAYSKVAAEAGVGRAVQMTDHRYDMRKPGGAWGSALVESGDQSAFSGRYLRGRAPATAKEIALSSNQADEAKVGLGDVVDVSPQPIIDLLDQGRIPVISSVAPLTTDSETVLNVNADTAAAHAAVELADLLEIRGDTLGARNSYSRAAQAFSEAGDSSRSVALWAHVLRLTEEVDTPLQVANTLNNYAYAIATQPGRGGRGPPPFPSPTTARWACLARISAKASMTGLPVGNRRMSRTRSPTRRTCGAGRMRSRMWMKPRTSSSEDPWRTG